MIILLPEGGLANRLRTIRSAINLTEHIFEQTHIRHKILVFWRKNSELAAPYSALFCKSRCFRVIEIDEMANHLSDWVIEHCILRVLRKLSVLKMEFDSVLREQELEEAVVSTAKTSHSLIWIISCDPFYVHQDKGYGWLCPVEPLAQAIDAICQRWQNCPCVGVHIRRTDHEIAIQNSPTEAFIEAIESEIQARENTHFYLACDDMMEKQTILRRFGSQRIITQENIPLNRDSLEGIWYACIDFFALSRTEKILGSYSSSFSDEASEIHKIQRLNVVRKPTLEVP